MSISRCPESDRVMYDIISDCMFNHQYMSRPMADLRKIFWCLRESLAHRIYWHKDRRLCDGKMYVQFKNKCLYSIAIPKRYPCRSPTIRVETNIKSGTELVDPKSGLVCPLAGDGKDAYPSTWQSISKFIIWTDSILLKVYSIMVEGLEVIVEEEGEREAIESQKAALKLVQLNEYGQDLFKAQHKSYVMHVNGFLRREHLILPLAMCSLVISYYSPFGRYCNRY